MMLRATGTFLLVASFVVTVVSDQTQEVYYKDDSTFIRGVAPKYRDASDFTTPSSDPFYVTIDGLPSNQHGFKIVNPQYLAQQSSTKSTASQKEEIRKQEEFVKSILEANSASIDRPKPSSNIFRPSQPLAASLFENGAFKTDSVDDTRFGALDLFGTAVPENTGFIAADTGESTTHSVFDFRLPQHHKSASSQEELLHNGRDVIGAKSSKPIHRNDFNGFQSGSLINNKDRKPSFTFREHATTPASDQVGDIGSASYEFGRFGQIGSSEIPTSNRDSTHRNRKPAGAAELNPSTFTPRPSAAEPSAAFEFPIPSGEVFGNRKQPSFVKHQPSFVPESSRAEFRGQKNNDEESKFISQVNQNTASFVSANSHVNGFQGSVPLTFESVKVAPGKTTEERRFSQEFAGPAQSVNNKRRNESGQRLRAPFHNKGTLDDRAPKIPSIPENRFSAPTKFQNTNAEPEEELVDHDAEARKQAEDAKYSFASDISDTANGNSQTRHEVRDGLKLQGMYSYSDGYFKRTVYYEADEGGYRVVKEESEPIGNGPRFDPNGEVKVNYQQSGSNLQYRIRGDQLKQITQKGSKAETAPRSDDYFDQLELPS